MSRDFSQKILRKKDAQERCLLRGLCLKDIQVTLTETYPNGELYNLNEENPTVERHAMSTGNLFALIPWRAQIHSGGLRA